MPTMNAAVYAFRTLAGPLFRLTLCSVFTPTTSSGRFEEGPRGVFLQATLVARKAPPPPLGMPYGTVCLSLPLWWSLCPVIILQARIQMQRCGKIAGSKKLRKR